MLKLKRVALFLFLAVMALPALAQVDTAWVKKIDYANQEPVYGAGRLLAVDKAGNIYLGAKGNPFDPNHPRYVVAKYNSCGDTLWIRRQGASAQDIPRALTVDDSGYVYVTGHNLTGTGENYFTVKFKPNGDTAWAREYSGTNTFLDDNPADIAVDKNGNVLVTGWLSVPGNYADFGTVKYAPNGDTVWVRRYDSGFGNPGDGAMAMAVDTFGNVYVTGYAATNAAPSTEWRTLKYSPTGSVLWSKGYSTGFGGTVSPKDIEVDAQGNAYVCGQGQGVGFDRDFYTIKYAPNGDTLWVRSYSSPGDSADDAIALEVDQAGSVYVVGSTHSQLALVKYDVNGNQLWVRTYSFGLPVAMALDKDGNIYVAGSLVIMYNPNGDTVWTLTNNRVGSSAIKVDTAGNVYVGGNNGFDGNVTVAKISSEPPCPPHGTAYTPAGSNVFVQPYPNVTVGFKSVSAPGNTSVTLNPTGPTPPSSFMLVPNNPPVFYDFQTTATYSDSIYVCLIYSDSAVIANEDSLHFLHYNGSTWVDATVFKNPSSNQICAGATSLSPFALAVPASCSAIPGDVNASSTITIGDIIHLVNYIFDKDKLPCLGTDPGNCWTPGPFCRGDANQTGTITIGDIVHLVNYIFDKDRLPCLGSDSGNCWTPAANGACCLPVQ